MSVDFARALADWQSLLARAGRRARCSKPLVTAVLLRLGGARPAVAAETGVLMASPSETTPDRARLGDRGAAASARDTAAFWQIVTAIGLTVTPLLASSAGSPAAGSTGRRAGRRWMLARDGRGRPGRSSSASAASAGWSPTCSSAHGKDYLAIDSDFDGVAAARKEGYDVLFGDVARPELIERLRSASRAR